MQRAARTHARGRPQQLLTGTTTAKRRILIFDPHPIVGLGLRAVIGCQPDLGICGSTSDANEVFRQASDRKPGLAIVGFSFSDDQSFDLIRRLHRLRQDMPIIAFSSHNDAFFAHRVLRAGARGVIAKSEPTASLLAAVRALLDRAGPMPEAVAGVLLKGLTGRKATAAKSPADLLSHRELEVFHLIARGRGTRAIAEKLALSVKTIETYRENIKRKLDLESGSQLVRHAVMWENGGSKLRRQRPNANSPEW